VLFDLLGGCLKKTSLYALFVTGVLLGNCLPRHFFSRGAEAAPADVIGSPNVAVDTYKNSKGTYVLWADGRITSAQGGGNDLGRPYRDPDPSAQIGRPTLEQEKPQGSPNVAVKAIPRSDATFILFADGQIRRPANADAAAGSSEGGRVVTGIFGGSFGAGLSQSPAYTQVNGGVVNTGGAAVAFAVRLSEPMEGGRAYAMAYPTSGAIPLDTSFDGRSLAVYWRANGAPLSVSGAIQFWIVPE